MKKVISVCLALVLLICLSPHITINAGAEENPAGNEITFTKVEPTAVTAGTYLISGMSAKAMDDGANTAFMTVKGRTNNRLMGEDLSINGDSVTTDDTACMWELIDADGGFYVKSVAEGTYLYWNSDKDGNKVYLAESLSEASIWSVVAHEKNISKEEIVTVYTLAQEDGRGLSCNLFGSSPKYLGFAAYNYEDTTCLCSLAFYKIQDSDAPHDHDYEAVVSEPTCTEDGYTTYTCSGCGASYTEVIAATGHSYVDGVCAHCGEADPDAVAVMLGDANGDGVVNYLDAMLIAQYYVGDIVDEDLNLEAADVNGDGTVNYLDAMMVAQYYVGDIDAFPTEN